MSRIGVLDIGTNTLLLLVVERDEDGSIRPLHDEARFGRLGKGLDGSGNLDPNNVAISLDIVADYRDKMKELGVDTIAAVGTQALREAGNADTFVTPAQELLGTTIEVIAGEREAELVYIAVANSFPELSASEMIIADVGGGSTEVIVGAAGTVKSFTSLPIGSVRMTERHLHSDPPTQEETRALIADIDEALSSLDLPKGAPVIGTAGTATSIASVDLKLVDWDPDKVNGLELAPSEVDRQLAKYLQLTLNKRKGIRGLEQARADVIAGGVAIYSRLLHRVGTQRFIVSDRGVRWGVAHELAESS
jgi:exopolyphosphatase/guanosine-5'-triphosphate,3'-diphosphate pyrophosphatase